MWKCSIYLRFNGNFTYSVSIHNISILCNYMISLRSFEAIKDDIAYFPHLACQAIYN